MKKIKDRKMTPLLLKQIAFQEKRIKEMMNNEAAEFYSFFCTEKGTYFSKRFELADNVFRK